MSCIRHQSVWAWAACVLLSTGLARVEAAVVNPPVLTMNPNGNTPLAGRINLSTDVPTQATLEITDGVDTWRVRFPQSATNFALPVLGLKPNRNYTIDVILAPGGDVASLTTFTTPLPGDFPGVSTLVSNPAKMEPGYTLLDCAQHGGGDPRRPYTTIVDNRGDVVWYSTECGSNMGQLPNGKLTFFCGAGGVTHSVCELDLLGALSVLRLAIPGVGLHHDLYRTAAGTYLSLDRKDFPVTGYPTSDADPNAPTVTRILRDDPIVEFAADGSLIHEWTLTNIIDPRRLGYDSWSPGTGPADWAHSNAVLEDPRDDSIVVSSRHQDAVVKFSRSTGQLKWILGSHANWSSEFQPFLLQPVGTPFEWQYHQHAPMITPAGTWLLFDNGNYKASPFDGITPVADVNNFSRAVEYAIDETNMEIRQVWEYGRSGQQLFAGFIGDADFQPTTGNVMITFGGVSVIDGVTTANRGYGSVLARIVEVQHVPDAEPVFDLMVYDPVGPASARTQVYRSERIRSLYAPDVTIQEFAGSVSDGSGGAPLTLAKSGPTDVTLSWGASCASSDTDFEIYEGSLGDFGSHQGVVCTTTGARSKTLTPRDGDTYYLIVPTNGTFEGSYGAASIGGVDVARLPGTAACHEQALAACRLGPPAGPPREVSPDDGEPFEPGGKGYTALTP